MFPSDVSFKDYFAILEISPFASLEVIQASYRTLARLYHPDMKGFMSGANKSMSDINEAYEVLSDPIKREGYWERFLQENIKKEQSRGQQFYFYKNWEESLKKREKELNHKTEQINEKMQYSETSLQYVKRFLDQESNSPFILREVRTAAAEIQVEFLEQVMLSNYMSLESEKDLLAWILQEKKPNCVPFITKAFKYKELYLSLFEYIREYNIQDYWDKILLISQQLDMHIPNHLLLARGILSLDWPVDKKEILRDIAHKDWLTVKFWERKKKSKEYQQLYKKLKTIIQESYA